MQNLRKQLVNELANDCKTVTDVRNAINSLFKEALESILEAEITEHLGYEKHSNKGDNSGNSRNGSTKKTVQSRAGKTEVSVPRDRNGEFEPKIIPKYQRNVNEIEEQVLAMYAKGLSTRDIEDHLNDIYGIDISAGLVSKITDRIMPLVAEWQSRPLEKIYPIVFLDAIHFRVRKDNRVLNKAAYTVLGITVSGNKDILGIWIGEAESASFWLGVCNDLKNRGVEDILIACKDNLSGFSEAINAAFPRTSIQLCVIHQIRNSMKYVPWKDRKPLMVDLKKVYQALTLEEAEFAFEEFKEIWGSKYPIVIKSWESNWLELTTFFDYPREIRRLIYTTNPVEGYHRQVRKVTKTKTTYPNDDALRKIIYLATMDISRKWTMPIRDWGTCISQFVLLFEERLEGLVV